MKIAVVGAGAMGGALAADASLAGHDVYIVDVSRELVDKISDVGLEIHNGENVTTATPKATSDASTVGQVDVIVLFVKAQHTRTAALSLDPMIGDSTTILSLQNGWGNADVLAEILGTGRLVFGVTYHSCSLLGLGVVNHSGHGDTYIGKYEGENDASTDTAAEFLRSSGWSTTITPVVRTEIWKKLILNAATLPTAALTGLTAGELGKSGEMTPIVDAIARETTLVAQALGFDIDADERVEKIRAVLAGAGTGKASMLQDAEAHRKTEIEVINAAVVRAGVSTSTATPLNEVMTAMIAGLEQSWTR